MLLFLFVIDCAGIDNPIQFCYFVTVHPLPEPLPPGAGNAYYHHISSPLMEEGKGGGELLRNFKVIVVERRAPSLYIEKVAEGLT